MKRIIIIAAVLGLVLTTVTASSAHQRTDRNWAAVQVPIDVDGISDVVMDGDLGDWDNVPSVFWVTQDDLIEVVTGTQGDPDAGNLAERIIVGWSPETNLVYVMEERFDDVWYGTLDDTNDKLELVLDADHSGGQFQAWNLSTWIRSDGPGPPRRTGSSRSIRRISCGYGAAEYGLPWSLTPASDGTSRARPVDPPPSFRRVGSPPSTTCLPVRPVPTIPT